MHSIQFISLRVLFSSNTFDKKERVPICLQECIEAPIDRKRWRKREFVLLVIIFAGAGYILNDTTSRSIQLTSMKQFVEKDLSLMKEIDNNIFQPNSTEASFVETTEINIVQSITRNNYYLKINVTNVSNTFGVNFSQMYKKDINITPVTTDKLQICMINMQENKKSEIVVNETEQILSLHKQYSNVKKGGYYKPNECRPRHKVGILVPYRDRETNLAVFMFKMHPFLMKQKLEYRIFIIEQAGKELFNRGRLFNAGFKEMMKYNDWHCVVFHDVDLLPMDDKILYTCPFFPRHMCATVVEKEGLPYNKFHTLFGGVTAMSVKDYKKVNGYSNMYWGWGGEDNDMFWRLRASHLPMVRYNKTVARYTSLPHIKQSKNPYRYRLLRNAPERFKTDGLSDLVFKVLSIKLQHLYSHIIIDINPLKENISDAYKTLGKIKS